MQCNECKGCKGSKGARVARVARGEKGARVVILLGVIHTYCIYIHTLTYIYACLNHSSLSTSPINTPIIGHNYL